MWTECTTGSVCEVNGVRPFFKKKSLQRPVSRTAHFNVSVSGLQEGPDWPLYKARQEPAPPSHKPITPKLHLTHLTISCLLACRCQLSVIFSWYFWNVSAAFVWTSKPECSGKMAEWVPTLDGGVWDDIETLTRVTTGSAASESTCTRAHTPAWKFPSDEGSTHHYKPAASPPSTLKHGPLTLSPAALLVNCQSHHSPWKDTRDTWLFHSAGDWLSQLPPSEGPPATPSKSSTLNSLEGWCKKTHEGLKGIMADWEDAIKQK